MTVDAKDPLVVCTSACAVLAPKPKNMLVAVPDGTWVMTVAECAATVVLTGVIGFTFA